mgnify:CR=1 FL=1
MLKTADVFWSCFPAKIGRGKKSRSWQWLEALSSLSNFITTHLGHMKAWATCNSLDWVILSTSHLRTLYIETTDPFSCFTYMYIIMASTVKCTLVDSRLIDLSLCCIICSQINKD